MCRREQPTRPMMGQLLLSQILKWICFSFAWLYSVQTCECNRVDIQILESVSKYWRTRAFGNEVHRYLEVFQQVLT